MVFIKQPSLVRKMPVIPVMAVIWVVTVFPNFLPQAYREGYHHRFPQGWGLPRQQGRPDVREVRHPHPRSHREGHPQGQRRQNPGTNKPVSPDVAICCHFGNLCRNLFAQNHQICWHFVWQYLQKLKFCLWCGYFRFWNVFYLDLLFLNQLWCRYFSP